MPPVAVAADARGHAAAQVVAQHAGPNGASTNQAPPRPPLSTGRARCAQNDGYEPLRARLPHAVAVEQNRAVAARVAERRQLFGSVEPRHSPESSKSRARRTHFDLPAAPVRAGRRDPCRAAGAHAAGAPGRRCRLTWVIGKGEHRLLEGLPGVEFVEYDKKTGWPACAHCAASCASAWRGRRFDALLQMQVAARANLLSAFIPARAPHRLRPLALEGPARPVRQRTHRRPARHPRARCDRQFLRAAGPAAGPRALGPAGARRGARLGARAMARRRRADAAGLALLQPCAAQLARRALRRGRRPRRRARLAGRAVRRPQRAGAQHQPTRSWPRCSTPRSTWSARTRSSNCRRCSSAPSWW